MILKLKRTRRKKVKERKIKKKWVINLTSIFEELLKYTKTIESTWLFPSRKGNQPISKSNHPNNYKNLEIFST